MIDEQPHGGSLLSFQVIGQCLRDLAQTASRKAHRQPQDFTPSGGCAGAIASGVSRARCEEEGSPNDPYRPSNRRARATPRTPAAASLRGCRLSLRWLPAGPAGPTADRGTQEGSRPKLGSSQGNNVESRSRRRSISSRALLIYTPANLSRSIRRATEAGGCSVKIPRPTIRTTVQASG